MSLIISFVSFSMESQLVACRVNSCSYMGTIDQVKNHYLWRHCTVNTVPYVCKTCGYRAQTRREMRFHRRVKHQARKRKEDLRHVCYGTYKAISYLHVVTKETRAIVYDNIPRQELISDDSAILLKVREAITNNNSCWNRALPTRPNLKTPPWEMRPHDQLMTHTPNLVPGQVQTCYPGRQVQTRFQQIQAQACSTWRQVQTCKIHEIPTLAFQAEERVSTHHNLSGGGLLLINNNHTDGEPLSGTETEGKQSTNALQNKTSQRQVSSTITSPTTDDISYDDELAEPEALPQHVTRLLALEEDDIMVDKADEQITEEVTNETQPETSSQSEINNIMNQTGPDNDINNVTSTMQELGLASQEKQDPPITNQDQEAMAGNSQHEPPEEDSDDNPAEANISNEETMPLMDGLKAKMKRTSASEKQLTGEMQQLRDELKTFQETSSKGTDKLADQVQGLKSTMDKLIPLMERQIPLMEAQISWNQQVFELLDKQMKMQHAAVQAQKDTFDKYSGPAGDKQ